jgi:hypothetical protein
MELACFAAPAEFDTLSTSRFLWHMRMLRVLRDCVAPCNPVLRMSQPKQCCCNCCAPRRNRCLLYQT